MLRCWRGGEESRWNVLVRIEQIWTSGVKGTDLLGMFLAAETNCKSKDEGKNAEEDCEEGE